MMEACLTNDAQCYMLMEFLNDFICKLSCLDYSSYAISRIAGNYFALKPFLDFSAGRSHQKELIKCMHMREIKVHK